MSTEMKLMPGLIHDYATGILRKNRREVTSLRELTEEEVSNVKAYFGFNTTSELCNMFDWEYEDPEEDHDWEYETYLSDLEWDRREEQRQEREMESQYLYDEYYERDYADA